MGTIKNTIFSATASDSTSYPALNRAVTKRTAAHIIIRSTREAQFSAHNVGSVQVPSARAVVAMGRVAQGAAVEEDVALT